MSKWTGETEEALGPLEVLLGQKRAEIEARGQARGGGSQSREGSSAGSRSYRQPSPPSSA